MKKFILLSLSIFIVSFVFGQRVALHKATNSKPNVVKGKTTENHRDGIFESFEGDFPPAGWTLINPIGDPGWQAIENGANVPGWQTETASVPPNGGNKVAFATWISSGATDYNQGTPTDEWLVSPQYLVNAGDVLTFQIAHSSDYLNNVDILLSTTDMAIESFNVTLDNLVLNSNISWEEKSYDLSDYAGQNVYIAFREHVNNISTEGGLVLLDMIQIGEIAKPDLALTALEIPEYIQVGTAVQISGTVANSGTEVSSFDVTYNINNGTESAVYSVSGVNIGLGETYDFTHDVPCNFNLAANYTVNVTISNVNNEENLANNTLSTDIMVYSNTVPRTVLLEQFTTENCPNCPPVLNYLEPIVENNDNLIMMSHHAGYYTDFLTIPESEEMIEFYNGQVYAPAGMFDRNNSGTEDPGPVFWDGDPYGLNKYNERKVVPSFATVNISGTNNSGELALNVSGEFASNLSGDLGVSLWITEDHINAQNQAGAANWVHRYSVRDAISARLGDPINTPTNKGDVYSADYTYTLDGSWNADELYLVAFINDMNATDVNDRNVLNAVQVKLSDLMSTVAVTDVEINNDTIKLPESGTQQLMAKILPANATNKNLTWSSTDDAIATVDANGLVTAVAEGTAAIVVTTEDGNKTDTCQVIVDNSIISVTEVSIPETQTIEGGDPVQLIATITPADATNKNLIWESSNNNILIVDSEGFVTGLNPGTANIIVTTEDQNKKDTCAVTVIFSVKNVTLSPSMANIMEGETQQLTAILTPANATNQNVSWSSSDEAIATVDNNGLVTAVAEGDAIITVTTEDGNLTATCAVHVETFIAVTGVNIDPATATIIEGNTQQLTASLTPENATNQNVSWSSSDETIATVNNNGLVTAVAEGDATITVTTEDGSFTATCAVEVKSNVSVNDISKLIKIYPNPSKGYVFIETPESCKIEVTNITGQIVYAKQISQGTNKIDLEHTGIYFIHFMNENIKRTEKIIIK